MFEGYYENDKKVGYGKYRYTDGREYKGGWAVGKMHGLGVLTDLARGKIKFGLWE